MRRPPLLLSALVMTTTLGLAACGSDTANPSGTSGSSSSAAGGQKELRVVATTTQLADFTRSVAGTKAQVTQILKPNIDPHDYETSPADVQAIAKADLVVINGVGLEAGWLDPALKASGFKGFTVDTSKGVTIRKGNGTEEEAAGDPHIWHNPRNANLMVGTIAAAMAAADPEDGAGFRANAAAYTAKLEALDTDIQTKINTLPSRDRKLVTNHDAFGYYVDRYRLQFIGSIIPSFDTSAGLSGTQINSLVAKIKASGTRAILSESSLPANAAQALAKEAGVKVVAGEDSLYGDTLGPQGSDGATYLQMEEHNTDTIVGALKR